MKTYEEMAQSALARGKTIRNEQKKTKKLIWCASSGIVALALLIVLATIIASFPTNSSAGGKLLDGGIDPMPTSSSGGNLNYGPVNYLSIASKTDSNIMGQAFQYISGATYPGNMPDAEPPQFEFKYGYIHVVAKAVEEYPDIYETLSTYGSVYTYTYRLFRMEILDPLESGMAGEFFYLLPTNLKGDLTQYDALLISMTQLPKNYVLCSRNELTAFEYLFVDPYDEPELGNIIAFTDGVFDESLWQDKSWLYGYQFAQSYLKTNTGNLLVSRGSTLEEALERRQSKIQEWGQWAKNQTIKHYAFRTSAAQQMLEDLKPFINGVFVPQRNRQDYSLRRYVNGCPTSEWITIDMETETITRSEYRFEDSDFENLPNLSTYIAELDLSKIQPQHVDPTGKIMIYKSAVGWYEKTENGVYSIVRIAWAYYADDYYSIYYDETFILINEDGDYIISREELIERIGYNRNIYSGEYGVGIPQPMC